jgi:hypothetical protein
MASTAKLLREYEVQAEARILRPRTGREVIKATIQVVEEELERADKGPEDQLTAGDLACIVFRLRRFEDEG